MVDFVDPAQTLGQRQAEAIEQHSLSFVRRGDAAQVDRMSTAVSHLSRQDDVAAFDLGEFLDQRPRGVAKPGAPHPLGQSLSQDIAQEANQDVAEDTLHLLVPDRADAQLVLLDPEGPLRLGQLDVLFPQRGRIRFGQVGPQQIAAFREGRPLAPALPTLPGD